MQEKVWKLYKEGNPYFVSNYGDVFNINKSIFMKKQLDKYGYNYVSLSLNHKRMKKKNTQNGM